MNSKALYTEKQRFGGWYLASLVGITVCTLLYMNKGDAAYNWLQVGSILFICALGLGLSFMSLNTEIYEDHICIRVFPFQWKRRFLFRKTSSLEVRKYSLFDYGGWGIRVGRNGVAYTVVGSHGIHVVMSDGKTFLIGTQRPVEVANILSQIRLKAC